MQGMKRSNGERDWMFLKLSTQYRWYILHFSAITHICLAAWFHCLPFKRDFCASKELYRRFQNNNNNKKKSPFKKRWSWIPESMFHEQPASESLRACQRCRGHTEGEALGMRPEERPDGGEKVGKTELLVAQQGCTSKGWLAGSRPWAWSLTPQPPPWPQVSCPMYLMASKSPPPMTLDTPIGWLWGDSGLLLPQDHSSLRTKE